MAGAPVESRGGILKNVGIDNRTADISERSICTRPDRSRLRRIGLGNFFRPTQAEALGITYDRLRRLEAAGEVERVARGLYRLADAEPTERYSLAAVCARVPSSVVCLLSALEVHEIGSRAPLEVWLAIPHKARPPRVSGVRVRLLRFSGAAWAHGVQETRFEGVPARITSPARTVVDCFRFERLIGREAALEALYDALRLRKVTTAEAGPHASGTALASAHRGPGDQAAMTRDRAASVKARLLGRAKAKGERFELLLVRYACERFLYRLVASGVQLQRRRLG